MSYDLTPPEHCHDETVILAARWLDNQPEPPQPVINELKVRFGITSLEAVEAVRLVQTWRMRRAAFA